MTVLDAEVSCPACGRQGLQIAEARRPDLVMVDLRMPDVAGLEVVRALRGTCWNGVGKGVVKAVIAGPPRVHVHLPTHLHMNRAMIRVS